MPAADDYPELTDWAKYGLTAAGLRSAATGAAAAFAEIDRLRAWKAEANIVLDEWEDVWVAAGRPGPLGGSKAAAVRRLLTDGPDERPT